jgi:hypothetical protein
MLLCTRCTTSFVGEHIHTLQVRRKTADEIASEEAQFKKELAELDLTEDHGEEGDSFLKDFIVNKVCN